MKVRPGRFIVVAAILTLLAFVSLTTCHNDLVGLALNTVYAEGHNNKHNDSGTTGGGILNEEEATGTTGGTALAAVAASNTLLGLDAGASLTSGYNNTFIGFESGYRTTTGICNTANGYRTLFWNTGHYNTANGFEALYLNSTGIRNTANGYEALHLNTIGDNNTATGYTALFSNYLGDFNTANGIYALYFNTEGNYNTANGSISLNSNTTGDSNTANGLEALFSNTTGDNNTAIGRGAGFNSLGSSNVFLGYEAGFNETGSNKLYIANSKDNTLIYGDFSTGRVGLGTIDPQRKLHLSSASGTWIRIDSENNSNFLIGADKKGFAIYDDTKAKYRLVVKPSGKVGIGTNWPKGKLDVRGSIYQRGGVLHADYVFESDYDLESIEEHAEFMWKNKHLAAIPKAKVDEQGQEIVEVGAHRKGIVEELEKAHIYIEQLHRENKILESQLELQKNTFEERLAKLDGLKAENEQLKITLTALADRQTALEDMFLAVSTSLPKEKLAKLE